MDSTTPTPTRMHLLDVLRFGSAAAVVVYHFTATPSASRYWDADVTVLFEGISHLTRYGWLAVEMFFVMSGFAILWSSQGRSVAQFTGSRVGRLYPAFWACIVVTAVLQAFWAGGRHLTFGETLANLTMAPALLGAELSQVVYWTLLVELKFYVLVGVAMLFGPLTRARVLGLAVGWPAVALLVRGFGYPDLAEHLVVRHAVYLSIGMVIFLLWQDLSARRESPDDRGRLGTATVATTLGVLLAWGSYQVVEAADRATALQGVDVDPAVSVAVFLATVGAVWLATRPWAGFRSPALGAVCVLAGGLTYPLYLVHTQFGWAVTEWLTVRGVGTWATLAAAVLVSVLLAAVIHYAVERPFGSRLRRAVTARLDRRRAGRPAPAPAAVGAHPAGHAPLATAGPPLLDPQLR